MFMFNEKMFDSAVAYRAASGTTPLRCERVTCMIPADSGTVTSSQNYTLAYEPDSSLTAAEIFEYAAELLESGDYSPAGYAYVHTVKTWRGTRSMYGTTGDSLTEIVQNLSQIDELRYMSFDAGAINIYGQHHDGYNSIKLIPLTGEAMDTIDDFEYESDTCNTWERLLFSAVCHASAPVSDILAYAIYLTVTEYAYTGGYGDGDICDFDYAA